MSSMLCIANTFSDVDVIDGALDGIDTIACFAQPCVPQTSRDPACTPVRFRVRPSVIVETQLL
jgi:hypothetical protein